MVAEVGVRQGQVPAAHPGRQVGRGKQKQPPKGTLHLPRCGLSHQGPPLCPGPAFLPWAFPVGKQER